MKNIKELWAVNRDEIVASVMSHKQDNEKRELKSIRLMLIVGVAYFLAGVVLLAYNVIKCNSKVKVAPELWVGSVELIVLGIYSLLYACIFYSIKNKWKIGKAIVICLMMPYHICIKRIKAFIKDSRQEHVSYLLSYYLIGLFIVLATYIFLTGIIARLRFDEGYNWTIGFVVVFILIREFLVCGRVFAYLSTRQLVCSVQKYEIKKISKINWRGVYKDDVHKQERADRIKAEWAIVKEELKYSRIYFYIILTVLVLCMPKESGTISELLSNQFIGITTVAALIRETKNEKQKEEKLCCNCERRLLN